MTNSTKILAICAAKIPSALVGVIEPLMELSKRGLLGFQFKETLDVKKEDIANADVVVCIRGAENFELEIITECKRLGKYVIYFLDDDLLNIPDIATCANYYNRRDIRENIFSLMKLSDCLWTTNINIAEKYQSFFNKTAILHAPALLLERENSTVIMGKDSEKIKIGFSGSIDHQLFLENLLENPIKILLDQYGRKVSFEFFGAKPQFVDKYSFEYIPFVNDHQKYAEIIKSRQWDIALAPLKQSEFNSCKYFNKFLEYGAVGAAGIYSKVEPYTHIVEHAVNGLLAENTPEGWVEALRLLIENTDLRLSVSKNAKLLLEKEFTIPKVADDLLVKIPELNNFKAPFCNLKQVILNEYKEANFFHKLYDAIKREGLNTPVYITKKMLSYLKSI